MEDLVLFYPEGHAAHFERGHPERPERVEVIRSALQAAGLWDKYPKLCSKPLEPAILKSVHTPAYLSMLEMTCQRGGRLGADTYTTLATWDLAHRAAGGAVSIAEAVWHGQARRGFALTRPPGHHAMRGQGMGFCLLNNVALAAEHLVQRAGAHRLAIIDLDLHHGNGTQDIFWQRADVLYLSTHQVPLYPGSGALDEMGAGDGLGATANFPLFPGAGDDAFRVVVTELILPLLTRFSPEMLLVSYGFDAHWSDPLGKLQLSARGYGELVAALTAWAEQHCDGRLALFLEGGYDLDAAAACSVAVTSALLGQTWNDPLGPCPIPESSSWHKVVQAAKSIWQLGA
jgi:acetoin utilization deacetylase AcuC-like enzyme